jgi:hypothetical protein
MWRAMARWFAFASLALLAAVLGLMLGLFLPLRSDESSVPTPAIVNKTITLEPAPDAAGQRTGE